MDVCVVSANCPPEHRHSRALTQPTTERWPSLGSARHDSYTPSFSPGDALPFVPHGGIHSHGEPIWTRWNIGRGPVSLSYEIMSLLVDAEEGVSQLFYEDHDVTHVGLPKVSSRSGSYRARREAFGHSSASIHHHRKQINMLDVSPTKFNIEPSQSKCL